MDSFTIECREIKNGWISKISTVINGKRDERGPVGEKYHDDLNCLCDYLIESIQAFQASL